MTRRNVAWPRLTCPPEFPPPALLPVLKVKVSYWLNPAVLRSESFLKNMLCFHSKESHIKWLFTTAIVVTGNALERLQTYTRRKEEGPEFKILLEVSALWNEPTQAELQSLVLRITIQTENCISIILISFTVITHSLLPLEVGAKCFCWPAALDILLSDPGVITPGSEHVAFHRD